METLSLSPHRSLLLPFVVLLYPLLYVIGGQTGLISPYEPISENPVRVLALIVGAIAVSYLVSVVLATAIGVRTGTLIGWKRLLFRPSERVTGVFLLFTVIPVIYFLADLVVDLPPWAELAVGLPLAWPAFVTLVGMYAVENAGLTLPNSGQMFIIGIGISLSIVWMFLLATWLGMGALPTSAAKTS